MREVALTAVVCTHNRAGYLPACVESLRRQTLARDLFEVIVVDNASTDGTADLCSKWNGDGLVTAVHEPVKGLSQARNTGWLAARGTYVGYLDDDAKAAPGWLESALAAFGAAPRPAWVGGPIDLDWPGTPPSWIDEELQECLGRLDWGGQARWLTAGERLGGGNSFYPREWLHRIGGFDTSLGRKGKLLLSGEETQLQRRIEAAGGRLYYHPGVRILHAVPRERTRPSFFYRRYYWGGRTDVTIESSLRERGISVEALPTAKAGANEWGASLLSRAVANLLCGLGLSADVARRIRGRVYLSYVAGRATGVVLRALGGSRRRK